MKTLRVFNRTLTAATFILVLFSGCSSLPKETVHHSQRNEQAATFIKMGNKQHQSGHYRKASVFFEKALASHSSVDDGGGVAESYIGLGRSQIAMGELDTAEGSFLQALQSVEELDLIELKAQALGGLGSVELHRHQPDEAIAWLNKALDLPLAEQSATQATLLHDLGAAHQKRGDSPKAEAWFESALSIHQTLRDLTGIATDCYSLALLHASENNNVLAFENARRALSHDKRAENPLGVAQDLTLLGALSLANGQDDQALNFYRRAKLAWRALGRNDQCRKVTSEMQGIQQP